MRPDPGRTRMRLSAGLMVLLTAVAMAAEHLDMLSTLRAAIQDAATPARLLVLAITPSRIQSPDNSAPAAADRSRSGETGENSDSPAPTLITQELRSAQQLARQLMIENARLRKELNREKAASGFLETIEPLSALTSYELLEAGVLSSAGLPGQLKELILNAGKGDGVTRSELVIEGVHPVLSAGTTDAVSVGDRVLTGAIVVGRIEKTARWVSMVKPVTASGFHAQVMLMRQTGDGVHTVATGILEGRGELECVITGIPHTDAVAIGDEVFSADLNGVRGPQLYYGRVVRADFLAGGQWDIRVLPAADLTHLDRVTVLRMKLLRTSTQNDRQELRP